MKQRQKCIEAAKILNDLIIDIVTGTRLLELFDNIIINANKNKKPASENIQIGLNRIVHFHLILVLTKWLEFYDQYKSVIPDDLKDVCRALTSNLKTREVERVRNSVVGHIWDKETRKPIYNKDAEELAKKVTRGDSDKFVLWLNNKSSGNQYPETVVSIFSKVRDRIRDDNSLKEKEVFP